MPKITILMTSYNHEQFVKESIESILKQTFKDFELIIVDDCSTDSSFEIIKSFKDDRIIAIQNERNRGPEHAFEILHKIAKGKFIAIADSDNVWEKQKLEKQVQFLENNTDYAAVFTRVNIIDEFGQPYTNKKSSYYSVFNVKNRSRQEWLNHFFFSGNCLCHPSVLIRKEVYKDCKMILNGLWQAPDFYKWIKLCLKYDIYILEEKLINFRIHKNNISGVDNVNNVIRSHNELYHIYELFYEISEKDFLPVFKEASKFIVNGKINIKFALSKLLLDLNLPAAQTLGLNKIFKMLNNEKERLEIYDLYKYDDLDYKKDETKYSPYVFNSWINSLTIYQAKLYLDFGQGFNEKYTITKNFLADTNGNFYIDFNNIDVLCKNKKLMNLRFDPCSFCSKIKIDKITSQGNSLNFEINKNNFTTNQYTQLNNYDIFYVDDPSYLINNFEHSIKSLSISGQISILSSSDITKIKNLEIDKKTNELAIVKNELIKIQGTFSWKITKPFRNIKKMLTKQ